MFKDKSGLIWIGTSKGISTFNPNTNFLHFKSDPYDYNSLSGDSIYGIHKDDDNLLWMGTSEQGVNIMDGQEIKYLNTENSNLISNTIYDITGYKDKVFIGTNNGLVVLDSNNKLIDITYILDDMEVTDKFIGSIYEDS